MTHANILRMIRWHVAYKMLCHKNIVADSELTKNSCVSVSEDFRLVIKMCNSGLDDKIEDLEEILKAGQPSME